MSMLLEVQGDYAYFGRIENTEGMSYSIITPSAAVGLLKAIYWYPGLEYKIDKIYVLNPIKTCQIGCNNIKSVIKLSSVYNSIKNNTEIKCIDREKEHTTRTFTILKDVHYVVEAHFILGGKAAAPDKRNMHKDKLLQRLHKGQCYDMPYLGCRDFPASCKEWTGGEIQTIDLSADLGYIPEYADFSVPTNITYHFTHAVLRHGVLSLDECRELTEKERREIQ